MDNLVCREAAPADVSDILTVRNAIFPPLSEEQWHRTEPAMTCSLAYMDGEPVGAIPLDQRDFQVAPGAVVTTAFENAVGTREDMRSKGIGAAMICAAKDFLADRCDMLMVYRGGERTNGYNFYVKSGHRDLLYLRTALWQPEETSSPGAVLPVEDLHNEEDAVYNAFHATYAAYGGFPPRYPGYWRFALSRMIYDVLPQETLYARYPAEGPLQAYVIAGLRTNQDNADLTVLDAASLTGPEAMAKAFLTLGAEAHRRERRVSLFMSSEHPWRALSRQLGFVEGPRQMMVMGQTIRPQQLFTKTCLHPELLDDLRIKVWTPTDDYVLHEGAKVTREITIEAKDEYLIRLLNRRLNLQAAVESDLVTIQNAEAQDITRLSQSLPYAPWAYLHLDYV
ncbi:MAG: GNAT family N-acetyltransferase [Armatimonadia bacterium]